MSSSILPTTWIVEHVSSKNDVWVQSKDRSIKYAPCQSQNLHQITA